LGEGHATHAELEDAGYTGIDPKDMLFKQYDPTRDVPPPV